MHLFRIFQMNMKLFLTKRVDKDFNNRFFLLKIQRKPINEKIQT
jgi:hypothetical protein